MLRVVFLNVGPETSYADILCRSVKKSNPLCKVIQVTDISSPVVSCADEVVRFDEPSENLMLFRAHTFSQIEIKGPTWYLDTDMIVLQELPRLIGVGVCLREFGLEGSVYRQFRGLDFSEHLLKTLGEVYPILACTTFSSGPNLWKKVHTVLKKLPRKYWSWYGDQEALKMISERDSSLIKLKESEFACWPEHYHFPPSLPRVLHFKGAARKEEMLKMANDLALRCQFFRKALMVRSHISTKQ